jgi:predicted Zn-dependent protease
MRINKVLAVVIGAVLLLALCAGTSLLVVNNTNNHNLAVQRAAATASHNRAVARASAAAITRGIAAANAKAARAEAAAKAARAASSNPAPEPGAVTPSAQQAPAGDAPQPPANAAAVVTEYYQDLSNGNYAEAWTLGGVNIAGTDYNTWVAGYATTTSFTLNAESQSNSTTVGASITATQSDGGSTSYQGTYTVEGGVITSADITQTG